MIAEIGKYIENGFNNYTLGENLFLDHFIDSSPDECIMVSNTISSGAPLMNIPTESETIISVYSRSKNWRNSYNNIVLIYRYLHGKTNFQLPIVDYDYYVLWMKAHNRPHKIDEDEKKRNIYTFDIEIFSKENIN